MSPRRQLSHAPKSLPLCDVRWTNPPFLITGSDLFLDEARHFQCLRIEALVAFIREFEKQNA